MVKIDQDIKTILEKLSFEKLRELASVFEIVNKKIASQVFFSMYYLRLSTPNEIRKNLLNYSRDTIALQLMKFAQSGIIQVKDPVKEDYDFYHNIWKKINHKTHKDTTLYLFSDSYDSLAESLKSNLSIFFNEEQIQFLAERRKRISDELYYAEQQRIREKEFKANILGKCEFCDKNITKNGLRMKLAYKFGDKYICSDCLTNAMHNSDKVGRLNAIIKESLKERTN